MPESLPLLEVEHLTKIYRGGWGLHDVSFRLPAGVIVALGGPNGSGKSTLLRCLAGLARHEGTVRLGGEVAGRHGLGDAVGFLPQAVTLPDHATIGEVIDFFARLRGVDPDTIPLSEGFVRPDEDPIAELSGGQRNRVALAVALLGAPTLLLLDEPAASLDQEARQEFWSVLRLLRDRDGVTSLVSSPSPSDLRDVADRAIYMDDGRIVLEEDLRCGTASDAAEERGDLLEASS